MADVDFAPRVAAAWDAMKELESSPDVVGAYHFGSSARPYADPESDIDIAIVVDANHLAESAAQLQALRSKLKAQQVDLSYWPDSLLSAPRGDDERNRLALCNVLYDPRGAIAAARAQYAVVPEHVRQVRVRIHYFEAVRVAHLAFKAERRGDRALVLQTTVQLVDQAAKLLFIDRGRWPSPVSWMRKELELLDIPLVPSLFGLLETPTSNATRLFRHRLDRYLVERGHMFTADPIALLDWYFSSEEGLQARREWCAPDRTG